MKQASQTRNQTRPKLTANPGRCGGMLRSPETGLWSRRIAKPARRGLMRSVTRSLTTALTVAAVLFVPPVLGRGVVAGQRAAAPASAMNVRASFVGTYGLVTTDVTDPS